MAEVSPQTESGRASRYPPLSTSPYWAPSTNRRERWWYSNGLWLDQGAVSGVVGFVWTHWLADRGVQVNDAELGDAYALELYREARRTAGEDPDRDEGASLSWAADILRSRGLLADCYRCPDIESVKVALLERGPTIAGIHWRKSLELTTTSEGWTVCRLSGEDDNYLGGHAVLLNGISLDLKIDGVTGFVRLKNSWGARWGDGGHALISLEDLSTVLGEETLLPIPEAGALRPNITQDVATEELPYRPREELYEQSAIDSDLWTRRDTVGVKAYAEAIARSIQHEQTKPPLTIGIKGGWGAGKTSLMRMVRDRLEWPDGNGTSDDLRRIHLPAPTARQLAPGGTRRAPWRRGGGPGKVTNRDVLRAVKDAGAGDGGTRGGAPRGGGPTVTAKLGATADDRAPRDEDRWRPTVWFNPWMYQTGEQIWAGLAHQIIEQITDRMSRRDRELFWLHLNRRRVDEDAVRRKLYSLALGRAVPFAIAGVVLLIVGFVALASGQVDRLARVFIGAGPVTAVMGAVFSGWRVLRSGANSALSDLVHPVTDMSGAIGKQVEDAYRGMVETPDYRGRSGALYLVQSDIQRVLDLVATPQHPLVIFIDDLDRCSPSSVVQVIEAVNLFVAGAYPNTIFVIALEPEVVAAHVEAVYGDLRERLSRSNGDGNQKFDLGWRFLEKIIQLPLAVPAMEDERTTALFASLFPRKVDPTELEREGEIESQVDAPTAGDSLVGESTSLSDALGLAGNVGTHQASQEALRHIVERRLTLDDPDVQQVVGYAKQYLHRNPREIKRFVNLLRFFTMIYTERRLQQLPAPKSLHQVGKLAVLGIRWPGLLSTLALPSVHGGLTVFELLENPPASLDSAVSSEQNVKAILAETGLDGETIDALCATELTRFLRSGPTVGDGVRGYL